MRHRRGKTSARLGVLAILVGAALALAAPTVWWLTRSSPTPADLDPGVAAALAEMSPPTNRDLPSTISRGTATTPAGGHSVAVRTSRPPATPKNAAQQDRIATTPTVPESTPPTTSGTAPGLVPVRPTTPPTRLRIDALRLDAPVIPIGVDGGGDLAIPHEVGTVGWYSLGASPGSAAGSVVMAGHVDSAQQGVGAFHALWSATPGMTVTVYRDDAPSLTYRVVSRETFTKTALPLAALFSGSGSPRLTLITCGGPFNRATLSYEDNVVVTAVPA